jgi:predicted O-linked N-acetylglucosamine transferase (SPINDLY family)
MSSPAPDKHAALALYRAQRLPEAQAAFEAWCALHPEDAEAWSTLGIIHGMQGQWQPAEACCRKAIGADPRFSEAHVNLGVVLEAKGQLDAAIASYQEALRLKPQAEIHHNIGITLTAQGKRAEALGHFQAAVKLKPDYAEAHCSLGAALEAQSQAAEAEGCYREALRLDPGYGDAWFNLGNVLRAQSRWPEAVEAYQAAIRINPRNAAAHNNLGTVYSSLEQREKAAECFRAVIAINPHHAGAYNNLGNELRKLDQPAQAIEQFNKALQLQADLADAHNNLGLAYFDLDRTNEAIVSYERALRHKPELTEAHSNLAQAYKKLGQFETALGHYREMLRLHPDDPSVYSGMAHTLNQQGRIEEAMDCYDQARHLDPRHSPLFALNYNPKFGPREIFEEHRRWGELYGSVDDPLPPLAANTEPERRLRVGYVSPDLRKHSVAYFIEPVLARHDRARHEIFCYAEVPKAQQDSATARLKTLCDHWVDTCGLSDRALAERIRLDGIDILVDLAGHTAHNRLMAFACRPAPVQLSYIGYANTTGLPAMGYRITDQWADPPGQEQFHTEQLVRLPHGFLCYLPPANAPPVADAPAARAGFVTFGSFNIISKTSPAVVALWARLMHAVPNSRLVMKNRATRDAATRERYYAQFQQHGIARERIDLIAWLHEHDAHLGLYSRIDIGLDTFPYNGTTTTCEALWMGVPVVTLAGNRHAARVGVSLLTRIGLTELIADSPDDYIRIAQRLSQDPKHLSELRHGLRTRIQASTLGDAPAFTRELEDAYRELWRRWCKKP